MLFVTLSFLIFFIIVYLVYWTIAPKYRMNLLLAASIYFYSTWSIPFTIHFIAMIAVNYYLLDVYKAKKREWIFYLVQGINIGNLVFFKYFYFLANMAGQLLGMEFLEETNLRSLHKLAGYEIILPLGISFYTFQVMAYGFDLKRGSYTRNHSFKEVLLFITFFPQLIAGPIMRATELLPAIADYETLPIKEPSLEKIKLGLWYILIGVTKKLFIADKVGEILNSFVATTPTDHNPLEIWILCIAFIVMLYSDFSAYSDLARGLGFLLGFTIPVNFRAPFFMYSFTELWKKWHLTFALWIRDYIFIPLGGSKEGEWRLYRNLIITFTLGGLWHGASYTFLIWGFLMGIFLSIEAFLSRRGYSELPANPILRVIRISVVWILYLSTGVFFFAPNWTWAVLAIQQMFSFGISVPGLLTSSQIGIILLCFLIVLVLQWLELKPENFKVLERWEKFLLPIFILILFVAIAQMETPKKDFFYFQF
jgi:alginate O-acetyltransferase complex protein AlgI